MTSRASAIASGCHVDAIGAHIGDEADRSRDIDALIEALGDLHRALGGEAQLARRLLGEREVMKGGCGLRRVGLRLDLGDGDAGARLDRSDGALGLGLSWSDRTCRASCRESSKAAQ